MALFNNETGGVAGTYLYAGSLGINLRASHTYGGWVRFDSSTDGIDNFAFSYVESAFNSGSGIAHFSGTGATAVRFARQDAFGFNDAINTTGAYGSTTAWHHLVAVYDAPNTDLIAYIDGVNVGTVNSATTRTSNTATAYFVLGPGVCTAVDMFHFGRILTPAEIFRLSRTRGMPIDRTSLQMWIPAWDATSFGSANADFSGLNRDLSNISTGTDYGVNNANPPVPWVQNQGGRIYTRRTAIAITGAATTQSTGAATVTSGASAASSGTTQSSGSAAVTSAAGLAAAGTTQSTGSASITAAASAASAGSTQSTGAAALTSAAGLSATGTTQSTGTATLTAAASITAAGLTQTTGTATVDAYRDAASSGTTVSTGAATLTADASVASGGSTQSTGTATLLAEFPITATGLTQTSGVAVLAGSLPSAGLTQSTGAATLTAAASAAASGTTQSTGAAALTADAGLAASGTTQSTGAAALTSGASVASTGTTQSTGLATLTATASITAAGLTRTTGLASVTSNVPSGGGGAGGYASTRRGALLYGTRRRIR